MLAALLAIASFLLSLRANRLARRRVRQKEAWPAFIESFTSALGGGLGRLEALEVSITRSPSVLKADFESFAADLRSKRIQDCLPSLRASFQNAFVDEFVELLRLNERLGGSGLVGVLKTHAKRCRENNAAESMTRSKSASTLAIAKLGVAAPWVLLSLLISRPESASSFESPGGLAILLGALATCVLAFRLIVFLGRPMGEVRVYGGQK